MFISVSLYFFKKIINNFKKNPTDIACADSPPQCSPYMPTDIASFLNIHHLSADHVENMPQENLLHFEKLWSHDHILPEKFAPRVNLLYYLFLMFLFNLFISNHIHHDLNCSLELWITIVFIIFIRILNNFIWRDSMIIDLFTIWCKPFCHSDLCCCR